MKRVSPGIRNRLIGYPVLFGGLYFGLCLMLANAYLKPARSVPKTPEKLSDVSIQTAAGADPAWATPALAEHKPVGNVVFVMAHGYGGTRAAWRGVIEKVRDAGFEAVAPCMPGQDASPDKTVGFGLKEAKVIVDTVRWARSQYPTSRPPKIILLGVSMGGAASWLASEQIPNEVDAVITEGAYARFDQTIDRWFDSFLPHGSSILSPVIFFARRIGGVDPASIVPLTAAKKWRKPALVIQANLDSLILKDNAQQLSRAAQCPLWTVSFATHANCYGADEKGYMSRILAMAKQVGSPRN